MNDDVEIRKRILVKTDEMFLNFGFSKVTMDEIASELGISKKTLYKHFESKEHLIRELVKEKKCETGKRIDEIIADDSLEFVDKLKKLMLLIKEKSKDMRGPMINDMIKCYPEVFSEIKEFRRENALCKIEKLIQEGMDKGIFRKDVSKEVVTLVYVNAIHEIVIPEVLSTLPLTTEQVAIDIIKIIFEGIFSEQGRIDMKKKENREKENNAN